MDVVYSVFWNDLDRGVASVLVFVCRLGILGVFLAVLLDEGVRALINFWKYLRIVKKWRE